jgi:hypothetical protein
MAILLICNYYYTFLVIHQTSYTFKNIIHHYTDIPDQISNTENIVYTRKDETVRTSRSHVRIIGLGDNDEEAFKKVIDLALSHQREHKYK